MSSQQNTNGPSSSPSRSLRIDIDSSRPNHRAGSGSTTFADDPQLNHPRLSPTLMRTYDPHDPEVQERQRTMDVDSALQLSRARSGSVALPIGQHPMFPHQHDSPVTSPQRLSVEERTVYPFLQSHEVMQHEELSETLEPLQDIVQPHHEPDLVSSLGPAGPTESMGALPVYQANSYRSTFDFDVMENYAAEEKKRLGLSTPLPSPTRTLGVF